MLVNNQEVVLPDSCKEGLAYMEEAVDYACDAG